MKEILNRVMKEWTIESTMKVLRLTGLVTSCVGTDLQNTLLNERWKARREAKTRKKK